MPKEFWDMYGPTEKIELPKYEVAPKDMPPIAFTYECDGKSNMTCLNETFLTPFPEANTSLPHNVTRTFRKAYYASVSWTDYLIGKLLDALDDAGVTENTIVALLGDHGWQLGEHNIWGNIIFLDIRALTSLSLSLSFSPLAHIYSCIHTHTHTLPRQTHKLRTRYESPNDHSSTRYFTQCCGRSRGICRSISYHC